MTTDDGRSRRAARRALRSAAWYVVAGAVALVFVLPLVWSFTSSLRTPGLAPPRTIEWWPDPANWSNYQRIFQLVPLGPYLVNSVLVVCMAVPITILMSSWAGFAMAELDEGPRRRLIVASVLLLMVPVTALWLTRFVLYRYMALIDNFGALIAPAFMGSSPFFVLLFYWTFRRIPRELFESAWLDGASALRVWAALAMPMARPTMIAVGVLAFVLYWSDFINPLLYLKSESLYTLPVGLQILKQMDRTNWPLLMAAAMVMTVPVVLVFLVVQRHFLETDRLAGIYGR
jgi:multiple sugar transport system permease protein